MTTVVCTGGDEVVTASGGSPRTLRGSESELIGSLKDKLRITGDILSTGARWDAQS